MQNKVVAKAFVERYLPTPILNVINTDSVKLENNSYIDEKLQETLSDLVFTCNYAEGGSKTKANIIDDINKLKAQLDNQKFTQ